MILRKQPKKSQCDKLLREYPRRIRYLQYRLHNHCHAILHRPHRRCIHNHRRKQNESFQTEEEVKTSKKYKFAIFYYFKYFLL